MMRMSFQPDQASVWACGGSPVSIRNITEALLTNDVEWHTADGMEGPVNLLGMSCLTPKIDHRPLSIVYFVDGLPSRYR